MGRELIPVGRTNIEYIGKICNAIVHMMRNDLTSDCIIIIVHLIGSSVDEARRKNGVTRSSTVLDRYVHT